MAAAVEEGVDIVPVYHFGNTQLLSFGPQVSLEAFAQEAFNDGELLVVGTSPCPAFHSRAPSAAMSHCPVGAAVSLAQREGVAQHSFFVSSFPG